MRTLSVFASMLVSAFVLAQAGNAQAQSWKRLCVSGGNTGGANNGTWKKLNTSGTGGGTWKRAGNCTAVIPPPPPPASLETIDLSGIPTRLYASRTQLAMSQLEFGRNGMWISHEEFGYSENLTRSGAFLINGAVGSDYEILISNETVEVSPAVNTYVNIGDVENIANRWLNIGQGIYNANIRKFVNTNMYYDYVYDGMTSYCPLLTDRFRVTIRQIAVPTNSKSVDLEINSKVCG